MPIFVGRVGEQSFTVDRDNPHARHYDRMLATIRHAGLPVYVETDDHARIDRLLIPEVFHVYAVADAPVEDRLDVELRVSHARTYVAMSHPDAARIVDALRGAQREKTAVLVTQRADRPEIIDVRPAGEPVLAREAHRSFESATVERRVVEAGAVTARVAQRMFDLVNAATCPTNATSVSCIPFLYPDQGCWARAHDMCRIMIANGVVPSPWKVWSYGTRVVATRNSPVCQVHWYWHVAPIIGDTVIDPSLFTRPASFAEWIARMPVTPPSVPDDFEFTDASVYWTPRVSFSGAVVTDPLYVNTNADLLLYRTLLANRSAITDPPGPPYNCR
jgi:hypothetical protein